MILLLGTCLAAIGAFIVILQTPQIALPKGGRIMPIETTDALKVVGTFTLSLMGVIILVLGLLLVFDKPI